LDVLAISNGERNAVWIVEVKSRLTKESVEQLLEQLRVFPEFYPRESDKELYGILAGVAIDADVPGLAAKNGLYLATIHNELFKFSNPSGFTPKSYRLKQNARTN
jgi:RecB family endonuclease NucS